MGVLRLTREPMRLDKQWQNWAKAWMGKTEPKFEGTGIAYMLRGDNGASNTDPWAKKPTADNEWVVSPAHIMLLFEDKKMLDSYPTDPKNGGPWVMWKGTPYAHLMVPGVAYESRYHVVEIAWQAAGNDPDVITARPSGCLAIHSAGASFRRS